VSGRRVSDLPVGTADARLPYSKGLMARALMGTGLAPERAYELARLIETALHEAHGEAAVTQEQVYDAAASVLASAQLFSRRTGPTVGPISMPGLVAAGVGVLTWQRLVRRRREHRTWVSRARELAESRRHARDAS